MARSPAFQLNVSDFRQDPKTIRMNATEIGAYFLLLLECWDKDNRLPNDLAELAEIARLPLSRFEKMWTEKIERCFRAQPADNSYSHKRIEKEIIKQDGWSKVMSDAGKKGAAKRWGKKKLDSQAKRGHSHPIASDSPTVGKEEFKNTHTQDSGEEKLPWAVQTLFDAFPEIEFAPTVIGFISARVKSGDETAWNQTVDLYRMNYNPALNSYMPGKIGTVLDVFEKNKKKLEKEKNGTHRQHTSGQRASTVERIADHADIIGEYLPENDLGHIA